MTRQQVQQTAKQHLGAIALAVSLLTSVGYTVTSPFDRIKTLEVQVKELQGYARASAIDLCLSRPDSTLARMQLDCRTLLLKR
jgi:hypothetical protein